MNAIILAAIAVGVVYFVIAVILILATLRSPIRSDAKPMITVVIAARDEEEGLPGCLESLKGQDYPPELWSVIVVDDRSTDRTAEVVEGFQRDWPALSLIRVDFCWPDMGGKQNALVAGFEVANGEIIAMTDADCILPVDWLAGIASAFTPDVGVVGGLVSVAKPQGVWGRLQRADMAYLMGIGWGFVAGGVPYTIMGNNLSVRKTAYDAVGGHRSLGLTIAEDCGLVTTINRRTDWKSAWTPAGGIVGTFPPSTFPELIRQRVRWLHGIRFQTGWRLWFIFGGLIQRVSAVVVAGLWAFGVVGALPALACLGLWFVTDMVVMVRMARVMRDWTLVAWSPFVTIWGAFYQSISGIRYLLTGGKTAWKGQTHGTRRSIC
jgi:1,2-diacylglycerol 3-beta-glucosyltransferase